MVESRKKDGIPILKSLIAYYYPSSDLKREHQSIHPATAIKDYDSYIDAPSFISLKKYIMLHAILVNTLTLHH